MSSTVQIARDALAEIENEKWVEYWQDENAEVRSVYLGSVMYLDPCGRYHHVLSPNGVTKRCEEFWESLEKQLEKRGLTLEAGEGNATDMYAMQYRDKESGGLITGVDSEEVEPGWNGPDAEPSLQGGFTPIYEHEATSPPARHIVVEYGSRKDWADPDYPEQDNKWHDAPDTFNRTYRWSKNKARLTVIVSAGDHEYPLYLIECRGIGPDRPWMHFGAYEGIRTKAEATKAANEWLKAEADEDSEVADFTPDQMAT